MPLVPGAEAFFQDFVDGLGYGAKDQLPEELMIASSDPREGGGFVRAFGVNKVSGLLLG